MVLHMFEALGGIGEMLVTGPIRENFCFGEIFFSEKFLFRANFCFGRLCFPFALVFPKILARGGGGFKFFVQTLLKKRVKKIFWSKMS